MPLQELGRPPQRLHCVRKFWGSTPQIFTLERAEECATPTTAPHRRVRPEQGIIGWRVLRGKRDWAVELVPRRTGIPSRMGRARTDEFDPSARSKIVYVLFLLQCLNSIRRRHRCTPARAAAIRVRGSMTHSKSAPAAQPWPPASS